MGSPELAKPEYRLSRNGNEEKDLIVALNDKKIRNGTLEDMKGAIRYCMLKVGLRAANLPDDEEKAILLDHIIQEYGNHTVAEIRLAFDMAIAGKLDLDRKDVVCYENFSCLYFSGIMNAYRLWAIQTHKQVIREIPKQKEYTKEEIKQINFEYGMMLRCNLQKKLLRPLK